MKVGRFDATTLLVGAIVVAVGYVVLRGIRGAASDVAEFVVKSAEGVIIGVGKTVGIPETDADRCERLVAAGEWWEASFYCPAGAFLKSATGAVFDTSSGEVVGYSDPGDTEIIMLN